MNRVVLLASLTLAGIAHATPELDVRTSYERYRKAMIGGDGVAAARELDTNTIRSYDRLRTAALVAPDLHALPLLDKIAVLRIRTEIPVAKLSSMDGRALAAHAITQHWAATSGLDRTRVVTVTFKGTEASAQLFVGGKATNAFVVYRKEKSAWRLDDSAGDVDRARALGVIQKKSGLSEDDYAAKTIKDVTKRDVPVTAWRPLIDASIRPPRR